MQAISIKVERGEEVVIEETIPLVEHRKTVESMSKGIKIEHQGIKEEITVTFSFDPPLLIDRQRPID